MPNLAFVTHSDLSNQALSKHALVVMLLPVVLQVFPIRYFTPVVCHVYQIFHTDFKVGHVHQIIHIKWIMCIKFIKTKTYKLSIYGI